MSHEKFQSCIDACLECATECNHCAEACLNEEDVKMLARCIKLDKDCAAVCLLAINAMTSHSEFAGPICALCADICEACAEECGKHTAMEHCQHCAEVCRSCAEECREMSKEGFAV